MWPRTPLSTIRVALLSVLTALCLGIQLLPRPGINLEFTSLITFVTGMVFGGVFGALLGSVVMFVNGFLSPYGLAGINLPFQILGMIIIGAAGGLYSKMVAYQFSSRGFIESAILGAFLTFVYDVITNVGMAEYFALSGMPFPLALTTALVSGVVPSIIHIVWNTALFGAVTMPLVNAMRKVVVWR